MSGRNRRRMAKCWDGLLTDLSDRARRKRTGDNSRKRSHRPKRWQEAARPSEEKGKGER